MEVEVLVVVVIAAAVGTWEECGWDQLTLRSLESVESR